MPKTLVIDNLKAAVSKADWPACRSLGAGRYDPELAIVGPFLRAGQALARYSGIQGRPQVAEFQDDRT